VQGLLGAVGLSVDARFGIRARQFSAEADVELGWIRKVMRAGRTRCGARKPEVPIPMPEGRHCEWVGESGKSGQLSYYERRVAQRTRLHRITESLGRSVSGSASPISVFLAVFVLRLSQDAKSRSFAVMAAVSIVAAVREAYAVPQSRQELIKNNTRFMCRIFARSARALDRTEGS